MFINKILIILIAVSTMVSCNDSKKTESANSSNKENGTEADAVTALTDDSTMIHRLQFSINIKADKEKIWNALWDDMHYRDWSGVFGEGSHYFVDNWEEGSKIMFLSSDNSGIYSIIEKYVPNEIIQFKHIGYVVNGQQQPADEESKKWSGATETYSLQEESGFVKLLIEIDVLDEHVELMSTKLPVALEKIKENSQ